MHLDLHITNKCNLHCVHCVYDSGALPMPDLTLAMVKDLSASLRALDVEEVHITGGEPLLNPECFQILSFLKDVGLTVKIQSNGMLLDPAAVHRLRQAGVGHILVSLDGLRETHDSFRNHPGAYDAAVQAIRNCVAAGLFTRVNTVVHRGNLRDLPALLGRVDALGVNQHSFFFLTPLGRAKRLAGSLLSFHEWRQVVASLIQETRDNNLRDEILIQEVIQDGTDGGELADLCNKENGLVLANGDVYHCVLFIESGFKLGNIHENSLQEIWNRVDPLLADWNGTHGVPGTECRSCCPGLSEVFNRVPGWCAERCQRGVGLIPGCLRQYRVGSRTS